LFEGPIEDVGAFDASREKRAKQEVKYAGLRVDRVRELGLEHEVQELAIRCGVFDSDESVPIQELKERDVVLLVLDPAQGVRVVNLMYRASGNRRVLGANRISGETEQLLRSN
jgi:hypothetical protein